MSPDEQAAAHYMALECVKRAVAALEYAEKELARPEARARGYLDLVNQNFMGQATALREVLHLDQGRWDDELGCWVVVPFRFSVEALIAEVP